MALPPALAATLASALALPRPPLPPLLPLALLMIIGRVVVGPVVGRVVSERGMDEHGCHFCNASFHLPPAAKGGAPSRAVRRKNEQADSRHSGKYQCFAVGAANRTYPFQRWHEVSRTSISEHLHVSGVINSVACESVRINPYRILNALPGTHAPPCPRYTRFSPVA